VKTEKVGTMNQYSKDLQQTTSSNVSKTAVRLQHNKRF